MSEPKLTYGIDKEGKLVHVDDVPNGLECECVCPKCRQKLEAVQGKERVHHFRHYDSIECTGAQMTALHRLAQEIIAEDKKVYLPNYDGKYYQEEGRIIAFPSVEIEKKVIIEGSTLIPDCLAKGKSPYEQLWIEIFVTHSVPEEKLEVIKQNNIYCMEIDCRHFVGESIQKSKLREFLLLESKHRIWLNCPDKDRQEENLKSEWRKQEQKRIGAAKAEEARIQEENRRAEERWRQREENIINFRTQCRNWLQKGDAETARSIMKEIPKDQFSQEEYKYDIYNVLTDGEDLRQYINNPVQNANTLAVFYLLLKYNYHRNTNSRWGFYSILKTFSDKTLSNECEITRYQESFAAYIISSIVEKSSSLWDGTPPDVKKLISRYCKERVLREKCLYCFNILWKVRIEGQEGRVLDIYNKVKDCYPDIILPLLVTIEQNYPDKAKECDLTIHHWIATASQPYQIDKNVWKLLSNAFPKTYTKELLDSIGIPLDEEINNQTSLDFQEVEPRKQFGWSVSIHDYNWD